MAIIPQIASAAEDRASGAQVIDGTLRFLHGLQNTAYASYLKRTLSSDGNRRIYTISAWGKRTWFCDMPLGNGYTSSDFSLCGTNDFRLFFDNANNGNVLGAYDATFGNTMALTTNHQYRDTGWYHIVLAVDTTQGTSANRAKLYVNGEQLKWFSGPTYPTQNTQGDWNDASYVHYLGQIGTGRHWSGNISQFYNIDGQQLGPESFGFTDPLTGTWRPKKFIPPYKPNSGQSWSGMCSGGTDGGYGHEKAFDGADNTNCYPSPGSTVTMTIPAGKLKYTTSFKAWVSRDVNGGVITVNGGSNVTPSGSGFQIVDLSGQVAAGADITEITWARAGSGSIGIAMIYIMIDGVALLDDDYSNFGGNGFYLPMDGNSPIGKDKSRRGNDFTPINFGCKDNLFGKNGSAANATVSIDTPGAGGLPILNTVSGGQVVTTGFRTDPYASSLVLAIPGAADLNDYSATIKGSGTNKTVTNNGATTPDTKSHYYGGAIYSDGSDSEFQVGSSTEADFAFAGEFTWEMWWYPISSGATTHARAWYFGTAEDDGGGAMHWYTSGNVNMLGGGAGGATSPLGTTDMCTGTVTMDAWNHIAVTRDGANKVRIFLNGAKAGEITNTNPISSGQRTLYIGGPSYETAQYWQDIRLYNGACKYREDFNPGSPYPDVIPDSPSGVAYSSELTKPTAGSVAFDGNSDYLSTAPLSDLAFGTGDFTIEFWVYMVTDQYTIFFDMRPHPAATQGLYPLIYLNGGTSLRYYTNSADRITGNDMYAKKWYHIAVSRSGSSTKMFLNGVQQGSTYTDSNDYLHGDTTIGCRADGSTGDLHGFMSNVRVVKGTGLYTSDFTPPTSPLTNITNTKLLCCQGSNAVNYAVSPGAITANGTATAVTFNPFDTNIDTVTGKSGQYCTWNPLWKNSTQTNGDKVPVLRNGDLNAVFASGDSTNTFKSVCGTIAIDSTKGGKWYYETTSAGGVYNQIGMCREDYLWQVNKDGWGIAGSGMGLCYQSGGSFSINKGHVQSGLTTWSTYGQLVSFLIDFDNNTVNAWVDGIEVPYTVDISSYVSERSPFWYPMLALGYSTGDCTGDETSYSNFGQRPFKFTPPEGYQPICEANMSSPGITNLPDKYFTTFSYNGSSATTFRKLGLEADLVWIKSNYDNVGGWNCLDTVRGASQTILLNDTAIQSNETGNFDSFNKEGVTVKGSANAWNGLGDKFVIYAWAAGGSKGTWNKDGNAYSTAATAGLDSTSGGSVNTDSKFAILRYTGTGNIITMGHSLGDTPACAIHKCVSHSGDWTVWHAGLDSITKILVLNSTGGQGNMGSGITSWNSTQLVMDTDAGVNSSGRDYILYLWANVPGVQKFGRFTGTNAADGPFVYLGFQPAVVILKETGGSAWTIKCNNAFTNVSDSLSNDNYGGNFNPVTNQMYLNTTAIDEAKSNEYGKLDFLSNGFKPRIAGQSVNSAADYIYMAWAAEPFHNLYGGQSNAR